MKICFLILAHQDPHLLARLIERLLRSGCMVAVHFDATGGEDPKFRLRELLGSSFRSVIWVDRRVSVVWGEWSMVQATLNGLDKIRTTGAEPDYIYLLSGSDYPIRSIDELRGFLERNQGSEFIESVDAETVRWVAGGIQRERYLYRHPFNWKKHPLLFSLSIVVQQRLKLVRPFPAGYHPYIGSQWWVLTWETCKRVLDIAQDVQLTQFFQMVWVPDEMFFQTIVRDVVHESRLQSRHLTLYQFTDYGVPVVYSNGLEDYLAKQPFFFARKISRSADVLRDELDRAATEDVDAESFSDGEIGRVSEEYHLYCMTYREGLFGRRVMGRVSNNGHSDLEWSARPYFVVIGDSREQLRFLQAALNECDDLRCHGELFSPESVEFVGGAERYGGYHKNDRAIRDHDPKSFFVDLLHAETKALVGYLACRSATPRVGHRQSPGQLDELLRVHSRDPNAALIVLRSDLQQAFREDVGMTIAYDTPERDSSRSPLVPAAELFARYCERQLERDARLAAATKESGARILFIDVDATLAHAAPKRETLEEIHRFLMLKNHDGQGVFERGPPRIDQRGDGVPEDGLQFVEASVKRRFHNLPSDNG